MHRFRDKLLRRKVVKKLAFWEDEATELTDDEKQLVDSFLAGYSAVDDDDERYARHWTSLEGSSTSTAVVKKEEEPLDPNLTAEDVLASIQMIEDGYGHIDATVKEKFPNKPDKQAKEAKDMAASYDKLKTKYEGILRRIKARDSAELYLKGIRDYDMHSEAGNRAVTEAIDKLLADIETAQWALKDTVANALRSKLNEIGEQHEEVFDTTVRECIFNDLVVSGLIQAFEPLDF